MSSSRQVLHDNNAYQPGANGGIEDEEVTRLQGADTSKGYYDTLVLNIPHSSVEGLTESGWPINRNMWQNVRRWTDWYTDYLFATRNPRVKTVRMGLSRFVVDVERLIDDPLQEIDQGIVYTRFEEQERLVDSREQILLRQLYNAHHQALKQSINTGTLLIDCHSFPSDLSDVDVCIGFNEDWSKPPNEVIGKVRNIFEDRGYKVCINTPYSNSLTPLCPLEYHSLMIELNKRVYMDETSLMMTPEADIIKDIINSLYNLLLNL